MAPYNSCPLRQRDPTLPRFASRGISTSTVDLPTQECVKFGRYWLPESCIKLILTWCPRVPFVLRMAAVSRQMRILSSSDSVWEVLDLSWDTLEADPICFKMTDPILQSCLDRWFRFNIRQINLSGCSFVSDWTLQMLSRFSIKTTHIDLHCIADIGPSITDAGLIELFRKAPNVEAVDLSWCARIGNLSLSTIADSCASLTELDLTGCSLIGDLSVMSLANSYAGPRLRYVPLTSPFVLACVSYQACLFVPGLAPGK